MVSRQRPDMHDVSGADDPLTSRGPDDQPPHSVYSDSLTLELVITRDCHTHTLTDGAARLRVRRQQSPLGVTTAALPVAEDVLEGPQN